MTTLFLLLTTIIMITLIYQFKLNLLYLDVKKNTIIFDENDIEKSIDQYYKDLAGKDNNIYDK